MSGLSSAWLARNRSGPRRCRHDGSMTDPGHRIQWEDVPQHVRVDLERALGSAVVEAVNQRGGYGPSLAARCGLADGRRVFIKAVSPAQNPDSPRMTRREVRDRGRPPRRRARAGVARTSTTTTNGSRSCSPRSTGGCRTHRGGSTSSTGCSPPRWRSATSCRRAPVHSVAEQYGAMFTGWRTLAVDAARRARRGRWTTGFALASTSSRRSKQVGRTRRAATGSSTATCGATTCC